MTDEQAAKLDRIAAAVRPGRDDALQKLLAEFEDSEQLDELIQTFADECADIFERWLRESLADDSSKPNKPR